MEPMKPTKWALIAATLVIGLGIAVTRQSAHADSVDCSGVSQWNADRTYKKGDLVWFSDGPTRTNKHQCILDKCVNSSMDSQPGAGSKAWKLIGPCNGGKPRS
jgi:hypothetical protein